MKSAKERLLDDVRNRLGVIADEASYHAADRRDVGAVELRELLSTSPPHRIDELRVAHLLRAEHAEDRSATRAMCDGPSCVRNLVFRRFVALELRRRAQSCRRGDTLGSAYHAKGVLVVPGSGRSKKREGAWLFDIAGVTLVTGEGCRPTAAPQGGASGRARGELARPFACVGRVGRC